MTNQALAKTPETGSTVGVSCLYSVVREIADIARAGDVSGILLGTKDECRVRILAFRRMVSKSASGLLAEIDRESLARLIVAPPAENELYGLEPVGWFRAQPRYELELSSWELDLLNAFFTEGPQVGMIMRSAGFGPALARFYVREPGGFQSNVYRHLTLPGMAEGPMLTVEPEAPRPQRPDPLDMERSAWPDILDEPEPPEAPHGSWVWGAVSAIAIVVLLLVAYSRITATGQQASRVDPPSLPDLAAEAGREELPPPSSEVRTKPDDTLRPDGRSPRPELADPAKDLQPKEDLPPPFKEPAAGRQRAREPSSATPNRNPKVRTPPRTDSQQPRPLRPFPVSTPRKNLQTPDLAPPPQLAREAPALPFSPLPQSINVVRPMETAPKNVGPPTPSSGTLIWTGRLRKNARVVIDGKNASLGTLTGEFPGKPVQYQVYPGDLSDNGILVFTARAQDARVGWDPPGPENGWNRILYEVDPHNARGVEVEEVPGPANSWRRLVLKCINSRLSVVYVKWSLAR
jgi:hypothetical protein